MLTKKKKKSKKHSTQCEFVYMGVHLIMNQLILSKEEDEKEKKSLVNVIFPFKYDAHELLMEFLYFFFNQKIPKIC